MMGYNIGIGEAEIDYSTEETADDCHLSISCKHKTLESAPDLGHGDISGKSNYRYPSYTVWSDFCDKAGIREVFFERDYSRDDMQRDRFRGGHPGAFALHADHLAAIKKAKEQYLSRNPAAICPSAIPCTKEKPLSFEEAECCKKADWILGRLNWLEFWMEWALKNCKRPVVVNS